MQGHGHSTDMPPLVMVRLLTKPLMYSAYCAGAGRSRPMLCRISSSFAGVQRVSGQYW